MSKGFTLIEVLLSVVIISLFAGLSLPIYRSFQTKTDLELNTQNVAEMLRRANTYARATNGNSAWGVAISSNTATVFKGTSYAARDTTADETASIPSNIATSGITEVVFSKFAALPSTTGTITLTDSPTNSVKTVSLNAKGMVAY